MPETSNRTAELIEKACKELPGLCEIKIELENGSAFVRLYYKGDEIEYPSNMETFDEMLEDAIEYSKSDEL